MWALMLVAVHLIIFQKISALKCWRCSSDAPNSTFCEDPFNENIITEQQRQWAYVPCRYPTGSLGIIPVCKKSKQLINDKTVIYRSCFWEDPSVPQDSCLSYNTPFFIKILYCKTCTTDGCNATPEDRLLSN